MVKAADEGGESRVGVLAAWRVCSGFAHARLWPNLSLLDREELPSNAPGNVTLKLVTALVPPAGRTAGGLRDDPNDPTRKL